MRYIILAQSESTANALEAWVELLGKPNFNSGTTPKMVVTTAQDNELGVTTYESVYRQLDQFASMQDGSIALNRVHVLVDAVSPRNLSAASDGSSWEGLIAMLILSFPEIYWIFGICRGPAKRFLQGAHALPALLLPRRDTLFDSTGLREMVKQLTHDSIRLKGNLKLETSSQARAARRRSKAASIDDEKSYAYFHGYVAWRFGFRTELVTSWSLMRHLFQSGNPTKKGGAMRKIKHTYALLLEDMNLNFPDKPTNIHLSSLDSEGAQGRGHHCDKLRPTTIKCIDEQGFLVNESVNERSADRILITSGAPDEDGSTARILEINRRILKRKGMSLFGNRHEGRLCFKPCNGIFDFWSKTGMKLRLNQAQPGQIAKQSRISTYRKLPCPIAEALDLWPVRLPSNLEWESLKGFSKSFIWPPPDAVGIGESRHSASGKLLVIAESLVRRAELFRSSAKTVKDCIKGAVLATEGLELLRALNPTLALQALSLKHEYEALAEVTFIGVGSHFEVQSRLEELRSVIGAICRGFSDGGDNTNVYITALEAESIITNKLAVIFRNAAQFDEEHECLVAMRWANRRLAFTRIQSDILCIPKTLVNFGMAYAEFLLAEFWRFGISIILQIALFSWIWKSLPKTPKTEVHELQELGSSLHGTLNAFFSGTAATARSEWEGWPVLLFSFFVIASGCFHIGIFLSLLFSRLSRR